MKNSIKENKAQNADATKMDKLKGKKAPISTPATDSKKKFIKDTEGLNQSGTKHNNLEPGF